MYFVHDDCKMNANVRTLVLVHAEFLRIMVQVTFAPCRWKTGSLYMDINRSSVQWYRLKCCMVTITVSSGTTTFWMFTITDSSWTRLSYLSRPMPSPRLNPYKSDESTGQLRFQQKQYDIHHLSSMARALLPNLSAQFERKLRHVLCVTVLFLAPSMAAGCDIRCWQDDVGLHLNPPSCGIFHRATLVYQCFLFVRSQNGSP
jgi:hypothetical protein